jgi:hypothetical protein
LQINTPPRANLKTISKKSIPRRGHLALRGCLIQFRIPALEIAPEQGHFSTAVRARKNESQNAPISARQRAKKCRKMPKSTKICHRNRQSNERKISYLSGFLWL